MLVGHLTQTLEPHDLGRPVGGQGREVRLLVGVTQRVVNLLAHRDPVQRGLRQEHMAGPNQLPHVPEEETEQQRHDVVAVTVGIHQQDDLVVPQGPHVEPLTHSRPQRLKQVTQFLVDQSLRGRQ